MAAPNIVQVSSIYGKTGVLLVTTTETAIVENTASSGKVLKINTILVSNNTSTTAADTNVEVFRSSVPYKIAHNISVPTNSTLVVLTKDNPIYLEEGDSIRIKASVNSVLHAICSYEEISQ